jgi:asparagine synthase (glutamine-hydrolysing)
MESCDTIFAELSEGLAGRQVVLPLSSGVDSRFIAAMLKRHGINDIVSYTYGKPGNWEQATSQQVAEKLGLTWHFTPYDHKQWRHWYESKEMAAYFPFAGRHNATPHVQDWPAVLQLKQQHLIDDDAVFMPGHTCVLISNRLDKTILDLPTEERRIALAAALFKHHGYLQRSARVTNNTQALIQRVAAGLDDVGDDKTGESGHHLLNTYFHHESTERHAKMLMNSVRVYEFFGHQWAMPLWDGRIIDTWASVNWQGRYAKHAFREFLYDSDLYGLFPRPSPASAANKLHDQVKNNPLLFPPLKRVKCAAHRGLGWFNHFLDWYGIVGYTDYVKHMGQCGNIYSILSRLYLEKLGDKLPR